VIARVPKGFEGTTNTTPAEGLKKSKAGVKGNQVNTVPVSGVSGEDGCRKQRGSRGTRRKGAKRNNVVGESGLQTNTKTVQFLTGRAAL